MSSTVSGHVYEGRRWAWVSTMLLGLILCFFCPALLQAGGGVANKTDTELAKAVVGTWEAIPTEGGFSRQFVTFKADGISKAIGILNSHGSPRRAEGQARWHVNHGYLIAKAMKTPQHGVPIRFNLRAQIESIENRMVKLHDEKGEEGELRRIAQLPSLPPVLTEVKATATYAPVPEYPLAARERGWTGAGLFACNLRPDGTVASVAVLQSTGHDMLDQAGILALQRWKFKTGGLNVVRVPLRFTMGGVRHRMSGAVISD
jgi:TonB family protein